VCHLLQFLRAASEPTHSNGSGPLLKKIGSPPADISEPVGMVTLSGHGSSNYITNSVHPQTNTVIKYKSRKA